MAITYPRLLPNNARMTECWFDLLDNVSVNVVGKTLVNISQVLPPSWKGKFVTGLLDHYADVPLWSGWRKSLLPARTFLAYDVRRSAPLAYPTAKAPANIKPGWDGTCTVTGVAVGGALSLSELPAFYQFKVGDRIGLEQSGKYGYYEVIEDKTATSLGVAANVLVSPFLHTEVFTTSAVCRVWRPVCQFIIDQSTWTEPGTVEVSMISFEGMQRL